MISNDLRRTLELTANYFDGRKVGCFGNTGYRKTTDLSKFCACIEDLLSSGTIKPRSTVFTDLGCGDGRVNLLMSYFVRLSIGVEIDSEILCEYAQRKNELICLLKSEGAVLPPENICLVQGNSLDDGTFDFSSTVTAWSLPANPREYWITFLDDQKCSATEVILLA